MNQTFDIHCIRKDPQAGICEMIDAGGGGSSCDCELAFFAPQLNFPDPIPFNIGGFVENNALSLDNFSSSLIGFYERVNNLIEMTVTLQGVNYLAEYQGGPTVRRTGFLSFSLPFPPAVGSTPTGIVNWLGPVQNSRNPTQISTGSDGTSNGARRVCIPGVVFPAGGAPPDPPFPPGTPYTDATIGSFLTVGYVLLPPFNPDTYIQGTLIIKCSYMRA